MKTSVKTVERLLFIVRPVFRLCPDDGVRIIYLKQGNRVGRGIGHITKTNSTIGSGEDQTFANRSDVVCLALLESEFGTRIQQEGWHLGDQSTVVLAVPRLVQIKAGVGRLLFDIRQDGDSPTEQWFAVIRLDRMGRKMICCRMVFEQRHIQLFCLVGALHAPRRGPTLPRVTVGSRSGLGCLEGDGQETTPCDHANLAGPEQFHSGYFQRPGQDSLRVEMRSSGLAAIAWIKTSPIHHDSHAANHDAQ